MSAREATVKRPNRNLWVLETRAVFEFGALMASLPFLSTLPRGDGHTVMVLPGLIASDASTAPLRRILRAKNFDAQGWELGRNRGLQPETLPKMLERLDSLAEKAGDPISLIGWSLGGLFARELAKMKPHLVRMVIALGSPFAGPQNASRAWPLYRMLNGRNAHEHRKRYTLNAAPPVPFTSIFSKTDAVVPWRASVQSGAGEYENIEVEASHLGLGVNPAVIHVVIDRLAQKAGEWAPFEPKGLGAMLFKKHPPGTR